MVKPRIEAELKMLGHAKRGVDELMDSPVLGYADQQDRVGELPIRRL